MRTLAILPIKSFGAAKQRLSGALAGGARQALAQAMFQDVMAALRRVPSIDAIAVVTADPIAEDAARGQGVMLLSEPRQNGQSDAAAIGIRRALEAGFERVLLAPGDTPLLDPAEVERVLRAAEADAIGLVVVPDRHGTGTNALLLTPPAAIEPAFGPGSRARHCELAAAADVRCRVEEVHSLGVDVDTPEDLAELASLLLDRRGQASMTRGALRQLDRCHAAPAAVS
jgi:2-phospho-L-lactate guanylyltransferase